MKILSAFNKGMTPKGRVEALSDGVYAIILTLLVLELKAPPLSHLAADSEILRALAGLAPKFLSWLISFLMLIVFWINHHHMMHLLRAVDQGFVWLNALVLLCQSFVPFPTALMGEYPHSSVAVGLFGAVMFVNAFAFVALHYYGAGHLLKEPEKEALVKADSKKSIIGPFFFLAGTAAAFWHPAVSFVIYLAIPLYFVIPKGVRHSEVL